MQLFSLSAFPYVINILGMTILTNMECLYIVRNLKIAESVSARSLRYLYYNSQKVTNA